MSSLRTGALPSLRKQQLLAEFAGLKQACPNGVFVCLTPGDPTLWSGAIFVRKGPYATAILRFQISFPDTYPDLPPLVTLSTDMFHPLVTPLTTYTYSTDVQDNGTVSASDDERLPPGGFSLRHGFPGWFGRASRSRITSAQTATSLTTPPRNRGDDGAAGGGVRSSKSTPSSRGPSDTPRFLQTQVGAGTGAVMMEEASTYQVLRYIRSAFDDESVLDDVPLEAAGNPGAWHAWKTHRRLQRDTAGAAGQVGAAGQSGSGMAESLEGVEGAEGTQRDTSGGGEGGKERRKPGEWNWDGVWEERVIKNIALALSEPVLFGGAGGADDMIRFLNMEQSDADAIRDNLQRTMGATA